MNVQETFIQKLKNAGHRITKARAVIIAHLTGTRLPTTASSIFQSLKQRDTRLHRTTVYRELDFLVRQGMVQRIQFIGQATQYEMSRDHHHHLVCTHCHSVRKITMTNHLADQEKRIYQQEKFTVTAHALEFYGLCHRCENVKT